MTIGFSGIGNYYTRMWKKDEGIIRLIFLSTVLFWILILILVSTNFNLSIGSKLGDTLAGILGTFISIIAAGLVYISFISQVKANREISKQLNDERVFKLFEIFYKELLENKDQYNEIVKRYNDFNNLISISERRNNIENQLFEDYNSLKKDIEDKKVFFEKSYVFFESFKNISNYLVDDYHQTLFNKMKEDINPYLFYIQKLEFNIPIIKIYLDISLGFEIKDEATFTFQQVKVDRIILKRIQLFKNDVLIKTYTKNKVLNTFQEDFKINFKDIEHGEYQILWQIKNNTNLFSYNNGGTYYIN